MVEDAYVRHLERSISDPPTHVAVIQDGNRRYARQRGREATQGHREGARTTENVLRWCRDLGVEELTLYTFSTENFNRPKEEREELFSLLEGKLREFADKERVHDGEVNIRVIGDVERLPDHVQEEIRYAERRTAGYDRFRLNIALAYGGRNELLTAARDVARRVADGSLTPEDVDVPEIEDTLYGRQVRDVDLIVRTGGAERTSNFLPWHANGNEAAAFFCAPYWPEFSQTDFLRAVRTYEHREDSWRRTRARRAVALLQALGESELEEARRVVGRLREHLPRSDREAIGTVEGAPEAIDGEPAD
jgi:tritrans,polycis-undecaprenyl-diphosphate synthase [geranylgeranyl-diphosphate specific]